MLNIRKRPNQFGIASLVLSVAFWAYVYTAKDVPSASNIVGLVAALGGAFIAALIAAVRGSKWWLLALLSPLYAVVFLLSLRT